MKFNTKVCGLYLICLLVGFFGASAFLNSYLVSISSFSFAEFIFLALLCLKRKELWRGVSIAIRNDGAILITSLLLLLSLVSIGLAVSDTNIRGVIGSSRAYLYILCIAIYFRNNPLPDLYVIYALTLGALIGDLTLMLTDTFRGDISIRGLDYIFKTNLMALYLCIAASILSRRISLILIVAILAVVVTVIGAFRINVAVMMIAVLFGFFAGLRKLNFLGFFGVSFGVAFSLVMGLFTLNYLLESGILSSYGTFRIVDRTIAFFSGDFYLSQDIERFQMFKKIFEDGAYSLVPRGLFAKNLGGDYNDLPLDEIFYVFSVPLGCLLLIFALYKTCRLYWFWLCGQLANREDGLILGFSVLAILFLLSNGRFLYIPHEAILYGMCLGRLFAPRKNLINFQRRLH